MPNQSPGPNFDQINVPVTNMAATLAFYRLLGLSIEADAGAFHAGVELSSGVRLEFDTVEFVREWNSGAAVGAGGTTVLGFSFESRDAVDRCYAETTGADAAVCSHRTMPSGGLATRSWLTRMETRWG